MAAFVRQAATESQLEGSYAEIDRLRQKIASLEERVRLLDELAHQDALVPVPNRRGFFRELDRAIARVTRYGENAAMLFIDIDGLKRVNDSFGHKAGDDALVHVANVLTRGVRRSDCVARLGGDEFGIILVQATEEAATETAERLIAAIEESDTDCDGHAVRLSVAVGVAMITANDTADQVIRRADRAMYEQKSAAA